MVDPSGALGRYTPTKDTIPKHYVSFLKPKE
jgi:hypothetical protein